MKRYVIATGLVVAPLGCMDTRSPDGFRIAVAPLNLPGVGVACYDLAVTTASETVWTRGEPALTHLGHDQDADPDASLAPVTTAGDFDDDVVCSDDFGNGGGGDITYIGTCDASAEADTDPAPGVQNMVTLWVDGLYTVGRAAEIGDWRDPCPAGCELQVDCAENADSRVTFDLTIMRAAEQGFFDVAVNFDDIFCSAKLDTCDANGVHNTLLHGQDAERDWTAVFGFACSAGAGDVSTALLYGDVAIVCGQTSFPIDPTALPGNNAVTADGHVASYGVYRGVEALPCDDLATAPVESCNKSFWNLAFSLDDLAAVGGDCRLAFSATATDAGSGAIVAGLPAQDGVAYPYIDVDAQLTTAGVASCQRHALDDGGAVGTAYHGNVSGIGAAEPMCHQLVAGVAGPVPDADCGAEVTWPRAPILLDASNYAGFVPGGIVQMDGVGRAGSFATLDIHGADGEVLHLGEDVTSATIFDADRVFWQQVNPLDPTTEDLFIAAAPEWTPYLVTSGVAQSGWGLDLLAGDVYALFRDLTNDNRYSGTLVLIYRDGSGELLTQTIERDGAPLLVARIGLQQVGPRVYFFTDYWHFYCGVGVLGYAERSGDTWTAVTDLVGQPGGPDTGMKVCSNYAINADGRALIQTHTAGAYATFVLDVDTSSLTPVVLPDPSSNTQASIATDLDVGRWARMRSGWSGLFYAVDLLNPGVAVEYGYQGLSLPPVIPGYVLSYDPAGDLRVTSLDDWSVVTLSSGGGILQGNLTVSEEGSTLMFEQDNGDGTVSLYVAMPPLWQAVMLTDSASPGYGSVASRGGLAVWIEGANPDTSSGVASVASSDAAWAPELLSLDGHSYAGWLSPDGERMLYLEAIDPVTWNGMLHVHDRVSGTNTALGPACDAYWVDDERVIAVACGDTYDSYLVTLP